MHIDTAVRYTSLPPHRVRTDLSATLFLSGPDEYDGGELDGRRHLRRAQSEAARRAALILYPSSSLHEVKPVTRGARIGAFFWIQSMVRDDAKRSMLFEMDNAIQRLNRDVPGNPRSLSSPACITTCCAPGRSSDLHCTHE